MNRPTKIMVLLVMLAVLATGIPILYADVEVARMTKEELKAKLDNKDVIVLDVRRGADWKSSEFKIPGAVYVGSDDYTSWSGNYSKDKTIVIYCA